MVDRIRQLLQEKQLTPTQFADAIGIARPIVSHILSDRNKPSLEVVQKILAAFTDLSMPWLLNGSGPMWTTTVGAASTLAASATPVAAMPPASVEIPTAAPNVAETTQANAVAPPTEDARPPEMRRQPNKRPTDDSTVSNSAPKTPVSATLPPPRRFQVAAPAITSSTTVEPTPEVPQSPPAVVATPEPTVAQPPVSASSPTLAVPSSAPASSAANDAAAFLLQPGKAIRRIVIFYQDGSFADYQPE